MVYFGNGQHLHEHMTYNRWSEVHKNHYLNYNLGGQIHNLQYTIAPKQKTN